MKENKVIYEEWIDNEIIRFFYFPDTKEIKINYRYIPEYYEEYYGKEYSFIIPLQLLKNLLNKIEKEEEKDERI